MSKKVNVNEAKVLELWSKGYNDKQVRTYLGLSVSTWDRWKKAYKQRTEVSTEVSTEVTEVSTEVPTEVTPRNVLVLVQVTWNVVVKDTNTHAKPSMKTLGKNPAGYAVVAGLNQEHYKSTI